MWRNCGSATVCATPGEGGVHALVPGEALGLGLADLGADLGGGDAREVDDAVGEQEFDGADVVDREDGVCG